MWTVDPHSVRARARPYDTGSLAKREGSERDRGLITKHFKTRVAGVISSEFGRGRSIALDRAPAREQPTLYSI